MTDNIGYHLTNIARGKFGDLSKIAEEVAEIADAELQGSKIMTLVELSDLYAAMDGYLKKNFPDMTMEDVAVMAKITDRAFKSGHRIPRD